jgi:multimeric flavodoxin WrbA
MRALILDGAAAGDGLTALAVAALTAELEERGYAVELIAGREAAVAACRGCFGCWTRTPGECVVRDDAAGLLARYIASDLVAYVTPVTFGGYSAALKTLVDRIIPLLDPRFTRVRGEFHHRLRYERYPRLVGLGTLPAPDPDAERTFRTLLARNGLNIHADAPAEVLVGPADAAQARAAAARLQAALAQGVAA